MHCNALILIFPSELDSVRISVCVYLLAVYLEGGARLLGQKFTHLAHLFLKRAETDSASARSYQMVIFTVINFQKT